MSSSSGAEETLTLPTEQLGNASAVTTMDAKLMVATASGDVQQLKDMVKTQESQMMVVVMAKQAAAVEKHRLENMDPHLLALVSSGSSEELRTLLMINREDGQASGSGSLPTRQAQSSGDTEANESILAGKTAEGDTALHVVAACGEGDNFFTRFRDMKPLLAQLDKSNNNKRRWWRWGRLTRTQGHALNTYGDDDTFLESARIIYGEAKHLLFEKNNKGNTPLHCAARAGKSNMVKCLVDLAHDEGRMKELLWGENKDNETALHEAIRVGNAKIVGLLMDYDSELASFPAQGRGASPMYLAYILGHILIIEILAEKSKGIFSVSGPNGQNILHAAALKSSDVTRFVEQIEPYIGRQNKNNVTKQGDANGRTPLHFAAVARPSSICQQMLEANPDALYQPDHAGFFPIHVAASVGDSSSVDMFVTKYPGSAFLRDAKGRTFLHVAVEKRMVYVIRSACSNPSLSWIINMVDNDGNTALHLAVEAGSLQMFCPLLGNPQVELSLPNNRGETPLDIAEYMIHGFYYLQSSEAQIRRALRIVGAKNSFCVVRNPFHRVKRDESKETEVLKDSTGTLCIGSVLIATVTFGATFAVPGGYIADDHNHGGSPILARRYAFDAFVASNTLAFVFSTMATISLMYSGSPFVNPRGRRMHLAAAVYLLSISITSLAAAFALGAYVVLAPVSHKTAVATCVLSSLVLLYSHLEFISRLILLLPPLCTRKGLIWAYVYSAYLILGNMLLGNWPLIFIFGWAAHAKPKIEATAPAPAPLQA